MKLASTISSRDRGRPSVKALEGVNASLLLSSRRRKKGIGERFGEWFEALLAKRVGRSKKNFLFLFYALRKLFPNKY